MGGGRTLFELSETYRDRAVRFREHLEWQGWRLKVYIVQYENRLLRWPVYQEGMQQVLSILPQPAHTQQRAGIGFVIAHQGRGMHSLMVNWWDRENEFFSRLYLRPFGADGSWREGTSDEAANVWDLQVVWFEREAFVRHVMSCPGTPDLDGYLAAQLRIDV